MLAVVLLLMGSVNATGSRRSAATVTSAQHMSAVRFKRSVVHRWVRTTNHWRYVQGKNPTHASRLVDNTNSLPYLKWSLKHWKGLSHREHAFARRFMVRRTKLYKTVVSHWSWLAPQQRQLASASKGNVESAYNHWGRARKVVMERVRHSSLLSAFLCIHHYEGAWNANTGNGYYGGLQMDSSFQMAYGNEFRDRWGTANNWPVWAQIQAAVRAYRSGRGFFPWPNTARTCGLI